MGIKISVVLLPKSNLPYLKIYQQSNMSGITWNDKLDRIGVCPKSRHAFNNYRMKLHKTSYRTYMTIYITSIFMVKVMPESLFICRFFNSN